MIAIIFFLLAPFATAESTWITDVMGAKTLEGFQRSLKSREVENIFYQRCQVELKGNYVPGHCYRWIKNQNWPAWEKKMALKTVDLACARALENQTQLHGKNLRHLEDFSPFCKKSVKEWRQVELYKRHREKGAELIQFVRNGRVLELEKLHANSESVSQKPIPNPRTAW